MKTTGEGSARTREKIWEAFYELCETVPFQKITVEQIATRAGVSKATFYRHFMDKYDVLNYSATEVAGRLIRREECRGWQDFLVHMFREIGSKKDYYRRAFRISGQNAHTSFLFEYSYETMEKCCLQAHGRDSLSAEEGFMIAHYCHGCVGIMDDWLRDDGGLSADEIAAVCYRIMPAGLKDTWFQTEN